MNISID